MIVAAIFNAMGGNDVTPEQFMGEQQEEKTPEELYKVLASQFGVPITEEEKADE